MVAQTSDADHRTSQNRLNEPNHAPRNVAAKKKRSGAGRREEKRIEKTRRDERRRTKEIDKYV